MKQVDQGGFSFAMLFTNKLFFTLIVSMCSTWLLYLFASILFLDPWHMATCFIQYLLLTPTYINSQYESELRVFTSKWEAPKRVISAQEKHEDYYKGFRSAVVLAWMFCNLALAAVVLNAGGVDRVNIGNSANQDADQTEEQRATIYMGVVLYSVAVLSAIRFIGACWFLVIRVFRGV
jgi:chitin synthase